VQAVLSAATGIGTAQIIVAVLLLTITVAKNLVLDLISALQNEPAARILPSQNGHGTLVISLFSIQTISTLYWLYL
jgi:hypothetical protein